MGSSLSISKTKSSGKHAPTTHLLENRSFLEEEVAKLRCKREQESPAHKRPANVCAGKEDEWRRERKMWKNEVKRLRKKLKEKDVIISELEDGMAAGKGDKEWQMERMNYLVEHLKEEQSRREEAVEKWKRLYLAIKTELDNLILRTCQGERLWWGGEEDVKEGLQGELKTKEEIIKELRSQIKAMEDAGAKKEREMDILRQSLRIVSNSKSGHVSKNLSKPALMKQTKERETIVER